MKKTILLLLCCMLLVPSFGTFFVYFSFKLNQNEISKTICVQRKMVYNSCNGRCELQKSLKKYEDNEKKMQNNLKEKNDFVFITAAPASNLDLIVPVFSKMEIHAVSDKKPISIANSTFRPPSFLYKS